jgi:ketosteroid isomerase-like protein
MSRARSSLLPVLLCTACHGAAGGEAPRPEPSAAAEVRARERAWLDAYEQRDPVAMSEILAEGFLITFPDGSRQTRPDVMANMRRHSERRPPRFVTRGTVALERPGVVILVGVVVTTSTDEKNQSREDVSTYTDTWVREGSAWRVLASHLSRAPGTQ